MLLLEYWGCIHLTRYKITVQYDGSDYCGWQLQKTDRTVQYCLEEALFKIAGSKVRIPVHGAGRTDKGVHAFGQVAHFNLDTQLTDDKLCDAFNGNLPLDCQVLAVEKTAPDFEARFHAVKRWYQYQCYTGQSLLYRNQAWMVKDLDTDKLNEMAGFILGEHDFLSFSKYRNNVENTKSTIYHSQWKSDGEMVIYYIAGNRFLHHMVRYIVGTMVGVVKGYFEYDNFISLLKDPEKNVHIHRAPACGLIMQRVDYE